MDILLIEDNRDDAELAMRVLTRNNPAVRILHIDDGEDALQFLKSGMYQGTLYSLDPRIILLDLKIPKVDGFELLSTIREHPDLRYTPVVILSSSPERKDIDSCYKLYANSYIVKPVDYTHFTEVLHFIGKYWLEFNKKPEK
jgi:CheY-like chemotaxis protein